MKAWTTTAEIEICNVLRKSVSINLKKNIENNLSEENTPIPSLIF